MAGITVLDASILIAHFDGNDAHNTVADEILYGGDVLATSVLTLAEALVVASSAGQLANQLAEIEGMAVATIPLLPDAVPHLAFLRASTGLKMPDVCVLYAGLQTYATAIATRDRDLGRVAADLGFETP